MTAKEIQILNRACQMVGIDPSKICPENPFSKSGGTAQLLQAAVAEIDHAQAARWRVSSGLGLSVATMAEVQSGGELSQRAMEDLWNHDAAFVTDRIKQREQQFEADKKFLEDEAAASRLRKHLATSP